MIVDNLESGGNFFDMFTEDDLPDNLFGSKKKKKATAAANQAMANQLIASGQPLSSTVQQTLLAGADGKISRKEKKLIKQTGRLEAKTDRVAVRAETKKDRAQAKFADRVPDKTDTSYTESMQTPAGQIGTAAQTTTMDSTAASNMMPSGGGGGGMESGMPYYDNPTEQKMATGDEPTGQLGQEKELEEATVKASYKKNSMVIYIIIGVLVLIGGYFLMKNKSK